MVLSPSTSFVTGTTVTSAFLNTELGRRSEIPTGYSVWFDGTNYHGDAMNGGADATPGTVPETVIQYALNNLSAARTWKERVALKGNFPGIVTTISIPSYTLLDLTGAYLKLQTATGQILLQNSSFASGNTDIEIQGGILDGLSGTSATSSETTQMVNFQKVNRYIISGVQFRNVSGECIRNGLTNTTNTGNNYGTIRDCIADDGNSGGFTDFLGASTKIDVINNHVNIWDTPVTIYNGSQIRIVHNDLPTGSSGGPCVEIVTQVNNDICRDLTIEDNNMVTLGKRGVWIHHTDSSHAGTTSRIDVVRNKIVTPTIAGVEAHLFGAMDKINILENTIVSPTSQGIVVFNDSASSPLLDSMICRNKVSGSGAEGFRLVSLQNCCITENRIEGSVGAGIHLLALGAGTPSQYNQLKNNTVKNSSGGSGYGIQEDSNCDFNEIAGNILVGNSQAGVLPSGSHTNVSMNQGYNPSPVTLNNIAPIVAVKAGTPSDSDFANPQNGQVVVDTSGNKIWVRTASATWKGVVVA